MPGPPPKPPSKRRRVNTPASYDLAKPVEVPAASASDAVVRTLGFDAHPMVVSMWDALQTSCENRFYSEADWMRVRFELWHASQVISSGKILAASWAQVQHGLTELLISPAAKRRIAIEVKPVGPDADENAAVSIMSGYRQKLSVLKPE